MAAAGNEENSIRNRATEPAKQLEPSTRRISRSNNLPMLSQISPAMIRAASSLCDDQNQCPVANEFFYKRETNLPMHPRLSDADVDAMIAGIRSAAAKIRRRHCRA